VGPSSPARSTPATRQGVLHDRLSQSRSVRGASRTGRRGSGPRLSLFIVRPPQRAEVSGRRFLARQPARRGPLRLRRGPGRHPYRQRRDCRAGGGPCDPATARQLRGAASPRQVDRCPPVSDRSLARPSLARPRHVQPRPSPWDPLMYRTPCPAAGGAEGGAGARRRPARGAAQLTMGRGRTAKRRRARATTAAPRPRAARPRTAARPAW